MEDKCKNIFFGDAGVEHRTFIMHRSTLYHLSYIPNFCLLYKDIYIYIYCMEENLKKKLISLEMLGVEPYSMLSCIDDSVAA